MKKYTKLTLLVICVFLTNLVFSQKDFNLHLHAGEISQAQFLKPSEVNAQTLRANQFGADYFVMVQFDHHLSPVEKSKLKLQGIELQDYIPNYAYIAKVSQSAKLENSIVKFVIPFRPTYKYSIGLVKNIIPIHAIKGNEVRLNVMKFDGVSMDDFLSTLRIRSYDPEMISERMVIVQTELTKLAELASISVVKYIEPVHPDPVKEGLRGRSVQRINMISKGPGDGYDGEGVVLGLADDGGVSHVDFKGRLTDNTANEGGTHGDMTAGLAVGGGNINPLGMGMATGSYLYLYDFNSSFNNPPVTDAIDNFNNQGQVISSTSYSESSGAQYTERSNFVDNQIYNNDQLLHFFSAGNSSSSNSSPVYGGIEATSGGYFGNITGGTKAAKNTIAVANMLYNDERVGSSSRGPTADGRVKPDISAHGNGNLSLDPNNQYGAGGGTSAASPSTAGTVAMLYDAYRDMNGGANPNGGLIKATILNTADDIGRPGPDYEHGWGRIHAGNAYEVLSNNQYLMSSISNNGSNTHTVTVPSGTKEVKVMVLWVDPAGSANASIALINDLNITMTTPSGQTYNPWILGLDPTLASLEADAVRGIDDRNNMEQVSLENPAAGDYAINVSGFDIPQGPQEYSLVYHFIQDEITVTYPNGDGEPMVPGVEEPLRWDAFGNSGNFTVEYSIDNGASWTTISNSVPGGDRYLNWTPPISPTGNAKIRVSRSGQSDESDTGFTIIDEPDFTIAGSGNNEAIISWDAVPGATSYDIYKLGDKYMEVIGTTTSTSYTLQNLVLGESNWYSVRATDAGNNIIGRRAYAKEYRYYICHVNISVNILTDNYPGETSWSIFDDSGNEIVTGGGYSEQATNYSDIVCVPYGCMDFVIYDSYGDGICCGYGQGSYEVVGPAGEILASGGQFGSSETTNFCLQSAPLVLELTSQTNVLCNGGNDGTITVQGSGGFGNYTYSINGGNAQTSNVFTDLPAGTHVVTLDDGNSTISMDVVVTEPDVLVALLNSQNDITCHSMNDGWAIIDGAGGTNSGGYTYSINNEPFSNNNSFFNLTPGSHEVKVRDDHDCEATISIVILEPDELLSFVNSQTSIDCNGSNNGSVVVGSSGGTSPFTYSFNGEPYTSNNVFDNLIAGTYSVTTNDVNSCEHTFNVTVTEPPVLEMTVAAQADITCFGENNGMIEISGQGGTGNLQYQIDNQGFQNDPMFNNLSSGTHTLEVIDDNGCISSTSIEILEPQELVIELTNQMNATCYDPTGAITINVSGGVGTSTINLNGNTVNGNTATFENLGIGTYTISVTDDNDCLMTSGLEITGDSPVELEITNTQNINCFGENNGMIEVQSFGGSGNYTYTLNGVDQGNNNTFTNLEGGNYLIGSTDDSGCSIVTEVTISEPIAMTVELLEQTNVTCFGENNGSLQVVAAGGVENFQYTNGIEMNTTGIFNNLAPGTYQLFVTDGNNCQTMIESTIDEPAELTANISTQQSIACFGENNGSVSLASNGGTGTITFTLNGVSNSTGEFSNLSGGNYSIGISDDNGCEAIVELEIDEPTELTASISTQQSVACFGENNGSVSLASNGGIGIITYTLNGTSNSTGEFSDLAGGTYTVGLADENGCETTLEFEINEPTELNIELESVNQAACAGQEGAIAVSANGGTGDYEFSLNNLSNSTGNFVDLLGGIYLVQVTDGNGCTAILEVDVNEPNSLSASILQIQNIDCNGTTNGSVQLEGQGGTGMLTYTLGSETNSTGYFENLAGGNYFVIVEDENNCTSQIDIAITEPDAIVVDLLFVTEVNCYGGTDGQINLSSSGGTGTLTYILGTEMNTTGVFENLPSGTYEIVMEDENGCTETTSINVAEPIELEIEVLNNLAASCGLSTGSIEVQGMNGIGGYTYQLNNETNATGVFENLPPGDYEIVLIDNNGCETSMMITIFEEDNISIENMDAIDIDCFGNENGSITVLATSPAGNISYELNGIINATGIFENLPSGNYEVIVSDGNECTEILLFEIVEPLSMNITSEITTSINCFGDVGEILVQASGATGGFNYTLNGETNATGVFQDLSAGIFEIEIIDANGCSAMETIELVEPNQLFATVDQTTVDMGIGDGTVILAGNGGTGTLLYSIDGQNFQPDGLFIELPAGDYVGSVLDENGCISTITFTIFLETAIQNPAEGIRKIEVSPNPFSEQLFLNIELETSQDLELTLWTISGVQVFQKTIHFQNGNSRIDLAVNEQLAAGAYFLNVENSNGSIGHFKLIKQ